MLGKLFGIFGRKKNKQQNDPDERAAWVEEEEEDDYEDYDDEEEYIDDDEEEVIFAEFSKTFGNVAIQTRKVEGTGPCLEAVNGRGTKILMEFYRNDLVMFPDGSNGYFFGNKLIIVTRWSNMTDAEKRQVETADLAVAFHPYPCVQLSLKVGENWGDVTMNLHHCWAELNDETAPVDEVIFLFADTLDAEYLSCRSAKLPPFIQKFLQKCNVNCHKELDLDSKIGALRQKYGERLSTDFYNDLYDMCWEKTRKYFDGARRTELDDIPDGIYVEINAANKVSNVYQND